MSPISFFRRHPHADLSAYLDGELAAGAKSRLDAHLAACQACSEELEALREARTLMRSLPEAPAPRSFALSPEAARRAPQPKPAGGIAPLVNGLRLTSAGLAVALAVVAVIAVSGGGSGSDDSATNGLMNLQGESAPEAAPGTVQPSAVFFGDDGEDAGVAATTTPAPTTATDTAVSTPAAGSGGVGGAGSVGGGGVGGSGGQAEPPATGQPNAIDGATPDASPADLGSGQYQDRTGGLEPTESPKGVQGGVAVATPLAAPETAGASVDDGGTDTLTVVAIVLAVLLAAALIGSIAASRLSRKTP